MPLVTSTLWERYHPAMALVDVRVEGNARVGSAFHIGDGIYATAAHVVDGEGVECQGLQPEGSPETYEVGGVWKDSDADVALVRIEYLPSTSIPVGGHLNDWVDEQFVLSQALLMGYPPIPMSRTAELVAVSGEVNAVVERYDRKHTPDFILSPLPRGGFSGGPAISTWDFALGVITQELRRDGTDIGFTPVTSVEPLWDLMIANNIRPGPQADFLDELGR